MKNSKKTFDDAGQSITEVKRSLKHDANLQKNSTLYFQIGLILCLLGTYALFEMQFLDKKIVTDSVDVDEVALIDVPPIYKVEEIKPKESKPKVERSSVLIDKYEEVDDNTIEVESKIITPDDPETISEPIDPGDIETIDVPVELPPVDFVKIEVAPVYPGCERKKTNDERKKCMSNKLTKLVSKKFNAGVAEEYGITGLQRIHTQFTVDKNGNITDVKIINRHPVLVKEAKRVIDKIPQMKPGYQRDQPVGVIYTLPITFEVRN